MCVGMKEKDFYERAEEDLGKSKEKEFRPVRILKRVPGVQKKV